MSRSEPVGRSARHSATLGISMVYMARAVRVGGEPVGYVRGAIPLLNLEERLAELRLTLLGATAFAVVIGLLGALFAARMLARPLQSMRDAAIAIAAGDYERRVRVATSDEVGDLGRAFNDMAVQLEREITTIRRDQREMSAILGGMVEGVLAVDGEERIALVNDAACSILDVAAEDVRGRPIWEALRLSRVPETLSRAVREGEVQSAELSLPRDGVERTVRLHVSPLEGGEGEARGAILVLDDITERRRLEEVRRDFIANASHELKTPVASIRGMAETVLGDAEMPVDTRRQFLERILRQSHRMGELIEEMLALSRLESETKRSVESHPRPARAGTRGPRRSRRAGARGRRRGPGRHRGSTAHDPGPDRGRPTDRGQPARQRDPVHARGRARRRAAAGRGGQRRARGDRHGAGASPRTSTSASSSASTA